MAQRLNKLPRNVNRRVMRMTAPQENIDKLGFMTRNLTRLEDAVEDALAERQVAWNQFLKSAKYYEDRKEDVPAETSRLSRMADARFHKAVKQFNDYKVLVNAEEARLNEMNRRHQQSQAEKKEKAKVKKDLNSVVAEHKRVMKKSAEELRKSRYNRFKKQLGNRKLTRADFEALVRAKPQAILAAPIAKAVKPKGRVRKAKVLKVAPQSASRAKAMGARVAAFKAKSKAKAKAKPKVKTMTTKSKNKASLTFRERDSKGRFVKVNLKLKPKK